MPTTPVYFDNSAFKDILKDVTCANPFTGYHIDPNGQVGNCCHSWLPTFCGNLFEKSLLEIINDKLQAEIKDSTTDGTFKFCNGKVCPNLVEYTHKSTIMDPLIEKTRLPEINRKKLSIFMDYDSSCNLYCGSCRHERILHPLDNLPEGLKALHALVLKNLRELLDNGYELSLQLTGSGDPFASPIYWDYLKSIGREDNVTLRIMTNGTLMNREKFNHPYSQKIDYINVSIDAFTDETYKKVRRGGNFSALKKNLTDLDELITAGSTFEKLNFWKPNYIVQADNFKEMADFAHWMLEFKNIDFVWFNLIAQWGHLSDAQFAEKAVWLETHPQHDEFLKVLSHPIFDHPQMILGNMARFRDNMNFIPVSFN